MKKIFFFLFTVMLFSITDTYALTWNIQGTTFSVDTLSHFYVGPGTTRTTLKLTSGSRKQVVYYTTTDLKDPNATIRLCMAHDGIWGNDKEENINGFIEDNNHTDKKGEKESSGDEVLSKMITHKKGLISGINADFFGSTKDARNPKLYTYAEPFYGHAISDGEAYYVKDENSKYSFALTADKHPLFGEAAYSAKVKIVKNNEKFDLTCVNSKRRENYLVLYTNRLNTYHHGTRSNEWGTEVKLTIDNQTLIPGKTTELTATEKVSAKGNMFVDKANTYVLSGHGTGEQFAKNISVGDKVEITPSLTIGGKNVDNVVQLVGGMPMLLENDVILNTQGELSHLVEKHPRTAVGAGNNKVVLFVADGRGESSGLTSKEVAAIMKYIGCTEAMNFDGGGSSEMYDINHKIVNIPSDGYEREVVNGLFVATADPNAVDDNTIASIKFVDWAKKLQTGNTYTPVVYGYNKYGVLINKAVQTLGKFSLECPENLGTISGKSLKVGKYKGTYALTARYGTASVALPVTITNGEVPPTPDPEPDPDPEPTPDPEPDPTPNPDPDPVDPTQEEMLTQITATPIATCTGSNGDQATFANGRLWIYSSSSRTLNWYQYSNGGIKTGTIRSGAGQEGKKNVFTIDEANHLIVRSTHGYFDAWDIDIAKSDRKWTAKIKTGVATAGDYIESFGNILNGGYLVVPANGKLLKVSKGELLVLNGAEYAPKILSYDVRNVIENAEGHTYLNHIGNGKFLVNSLQGRYFVCNADGTDRSNVGQNVLGEVFESTNRAGKVRMNTLGGCYVNLSGKDIYFYNTYENDKSKKESLRFTGCVVNGRTMGAAGTKPQGGYYYNPTLLDNTSFTTAPKVNFMFADKKSETECLIYQYSPADNTVRCYRVNVLGSNDVMTATAATKMEFGTQTGKYKELNTELTVDVPVISNLNTTINFKGSNQHFAIGDISGRVKDGSNNIVAENKNPDKGTITLTDLECNDYKYRYDAKYSWYGADLGKTIQREVTFTHNYEANPATNPHGRIFWIKRSAQAPERAQIVIDFDVPASYRNIPVSEYRIHMISNKTAQKGLKTVKDAVVAKVRGNMPEEGIIPKADDEVQMDYNFKFMATHVIYNVKDVDAAKQIASNNTFVVETVYGLEGNKAYKSLKSEPFSVKSDDIVTGVETIENDNEIALNPTLADDVITVSVGEGVHSVAIYSVNGICVSRVACDGGNLQIMPVEHLSQGCYLVVVNNDKTLRFIKR